jgi:hypothetical protein
MRRGLITTAAALAAVVAGAPAAHGADLPGMGKDIAYDVKVEGQGTYTYAERLDRGDGDWDGHDVAMTFNYEGEITDGVVFRNASPLDTTGDDIPQGSAAGTFTLTGSDGAGASCTVDQGSNPIHGWMRMVDDADLTMVAPLDGSMDLWIRPFDDFNVQFDCPSEDTHPGVGLVKGAIDAELDDQGRVKIGQSPFDIRFNLPRDIVGMGQIQQLDPAKVIEGVACPGYYADQTTTCRLAWTAKVTLTKIWEKAAPSTTSTPPAQGRPPADKHPDDDLLVPLVPPKPDPDDDLLVPLVPQAKASLSADASKASFSVSCRGGCTGTASLTAGTAGARAGAAASRAARKPLARARFTVRAGAARKVTLRLGAKARRAVRRAGGARVVVKLTARGHTTTRTLKLRLPRRTVHR